MRETKFVGMEYFGSRDETTRRASLVEVERAAESGTRGAYVGVFAARYGSGITEVEYRRARELGLRCFIYFKDDAAISDDSREAEAAEAAKLAALKRELRANHIIGPDFTSPDDLAAKVTADLHRWLFDEYLTPKLQGALDGTVSREEAEALLNAVRDLSALNRELVSRVRSTVVNVAPGGSYAARDNITNIYNAPAASAPVIPTLHQLRAPVGDFVGREKEINELLATLRGGASAAISGISGMGGIGKTELAFYVANELRDAYPDAQLVVDMRGTDDAPRDPSDALAACIRAFAGVEQQLPDDLQALTHIYRSVLDGRRALILLDNARDSAQARPLMPPAGSALLVTSRETVALPGMKRVTLEQLEPVEARELLKGIASRVPDDVADRICFLCGYLPLAIRAAGSLLDVTADLAPDDYATQLGDERRRLELIGAEGVDYGVEASFGLSYARLSPDAARVFRQLAAFPAFFDARAEETICEDPGHKHLSELLRRNLVRFNEGTQRYSLHDLARLFADSRMTDDEGHATRMRHSAHYLTVLGECDAYYLKGGEAIKSGLALFDVERRNIEAGQEWACCHESEGEAAALLCNDYPNAGAYVLSLRQHPREFISWLEAALAAARQLKDRASEGRHSGNLGYAYNDLGEHRRAIEFCEQQLIITRAIDDRRGEGSALLNLGIAYKNLGESHRAIEFYEQALVVSREVGNRRSEGNALGNLGNVYTELGEPRRAIEFYEQQLAITRAIGDRRGEGIALGNLGIAYKNLDEPQRAVEFYEQALVIAREIGDRRGEGNALGSLGVTYTNLDEPQRAVEFYEQQLIIVCEIGDRIGEGVALFNNGQVLDKLGDRAKAIAHTEAALEIFEQLESPYAQSARATLALWRGEA
jgi:tetratricopeptide (TPR) repeat protein